MDSSQKKSGIASAWAREQHHYSMFLNQLCGLLWFSARIKAETDLVAYDRFDLLIIAEMAFPHLLRYRR